MLLTELKSGLSFALITSFLHLSKELIIDFHLIEPQFSIDNNLLLDIDKLAVSFKTVDGEVQAVRNVSYKVYSGEVLGVVGESGSGKSVTALRILRLLEANAILKVAASTQSCRGATLYITLSPCKECSKLIHQSGIKRVVYVDKYKDTSGLEFLEKAGVEIMQITI